MKHHIIKVLLLAMAVAICLGCKYSSPGDSNNQPVSKKDYNTYQDAVRDGDFESAYRYLDNYYKEYIEAIANTMAVIGTKEYKKISTAYSSTRATYYAAFDYIYKAEIRHIITNLEGQDACDKIVFLLDEIPISGKKWPQGLQDKDITRDRYAVFYETEPYLDYVQHFNELCNSVLVLSINRKNKLLAQQILLHFVDNVEIFDSDQQKTINKVEIPYWMVYVNYTRKDALVAQKKYKEAEAMGMFK